MKEWLNRVYFGDCIRSLNAMPEKFVHTCVTSPPYFGLRDYGSGRWEGGDPTHDHAKEVGTRVIGRNDGDRYGESSTFTGQKKTARAVRPNPRTSPTIATHRDVAQHEAHDVQKMKRVAQCSCGAVFVDEQIGQEQTPEEYVANMVNVFRAVRRVLRDDGTVWLNLGDTYAGNGGYTPDAPSNVKRMEALARGERMDGSFGVSKRNNESHTAPKRRVYEGVKPKDLIGIPWMVAFALRADGWYLRSDIIWNKPNPMPESITDRPTKAHEYIFMLSKSDRYYYDAAAIAEPSLTAGSKHHMGKGKTGQRAYAMGRTPSGNERPDAPPVTIKETKNKRSVWTVPAKPYSGAHFATYPEELIEPCILAGSPVRGVVLDPFIGSGTTAAVAARLERYWVGCELNDSNHYLQLERLGRTWLYDDPPARARVRLNGSGDRVRL